LLEKKKNGEFEAMPRKEVTRLRRELERMDKIYSGIISLGELPACIYVVDPKKETACVREANRLAIPIVGLIDTDADPDVIDWPVPGNDDAIKSVRYITSAFTAAIKEEQNKTAQILKKKEEETEKVSEEKKEEPDVEKYEVLDEEAIKEKETKTTPKKRSPRKEV
jgi:small subunit ribosomal protein S2